MKTATNSINLTLTCTETEGGPFYAEFDCWCGTTHTDHYEWLQHQCTHDSPLLDFHPLGETPKDFCLMCPDCGKSFSREAVALP